MRWYISALIIILSLLGVVDQHQVPVPNQEMVLQFTNTEVSSDDAQNTIAGITKQLHELGVDHILVSKGEEKGTLVITYYSDIDVAGIKDLLSNDAKIALNKSNNDDGDSKLPIKDDTGNYNLDIYEIQKTSNSDWDLNGTHITELKPEGHRFSNPDAYPFIDTIDVSDIKEHVAYSSYYDITLSIDNTSYKIPEVRAGPLV